jgi:signal transduction histidine kinase/tetratricopeptide (TPR) repeat protein
MKRNIFKTAVILIFIPFLLFSFPDSPVDVEVLEKELNAPNISQKEKIRLLVQLSEFYQDSEPLKAVKYGKEALEILQQSKLDNPTLEIRILLHLTWATQNVGQYETALEYGYKAETLTLEIGDKQATVIAYNNIGWIYQRLGFPDHSLDYALRALKSSEELKDHKNIAEAYINIGNVYMALKDSKQALKQYQNALYILQGGGDKKSVARVLINIGNVYHACRQYREALDYYRESQNMVEKLNWQMGRAAALGSIAAVYADTGKPDRALETNRMALEICKKIEQKRMIAILLGNIGVCHRKLGQHNKALQYVDQALDIAKEIKNKDITVNFYDELHNIYISLKDFEKSAYVNFNKSKTINDEIFSEECKKKISNLLQRFETETKEREIQRLRIQQLKSERREWVQNLFIVVSLLVLVLAGVIYSRYRTKKKAERQLKESENKLRAMNTAKDKLFSIIAHDLESPLSGLILSTGYLEKNYHHLEENEVKEFLHQIYENTNHISKLLDNLLLWAVSQLEKLDVEPETLDLHRLAKEAIELLEPSAFEKNIRLMSHINENTLAWADKRMVETIMRNLLSNALKYSNNGGEVHISSQYSGNLLEVAISDNGVGIPEDKRDTLFDPYIYNSTRGTGGEKGTGLGLVLCKEFVEKNGGTIQAERNNNNETNTGTRMVFTLPVQAGQRMEMQ